VSANNAAYSFTVTVVQPNQGQIDSGSNQFGSQCRSYQIPANFTGTLTLRVDVTGPGGAQSNASASVEVHGPRLSSIDAYWVDSEFNLRTQFHVGEEAGFCWDVVPDDLPHNLVLVQTGVGTIDSRTNVTGGDCIFDDVGSLDLERGFIEVTAQATAGGATVSDTARVNIVD
jgi:hypothetical protein